MTKVISIYHLSPTDRLKVRSGSLPGHVYIGRDARNKGLGEWGNRYSHLPSTLPSTVLVHSREEAVDKYAVEKWAEPGFKERVRRELRGKTLVCYCKPQACHGDILAQMADGDEGADTLFKTKPDSDSSPEMKKSKTKVKTDKSMAKTPKTLDIIADDASSTPVPASVDSTNPLVVAAKTYVSTKTQTVLSEIQALTVTDENDYADADILLVRIRQARAIVASKLDPIIKPIRAGLDSLYALRRELDEPLESGEKSVKGKMARWQADEARKREEARQLALAEERRIARAAEESRLVAERQASEAKTRSQRAEAERLRQIAETQEADRQRAEEARKVAESAKAVKGVGSRVTVVTYAEVTDLTVFLKAVVEGKVPEICVQVNESVLKTYWEDDAGLVSAWPGVEVKTETRVGGR